MKIFNRHIIMVTLVAATTIIANAQHTRSGYFIDNYMYRFQMNPAMGNDTNFIATPAIGNVNASLTGTLKLSSVLYNRGGRTVTFMNPEVSAAEVMHNMHGNNRLHTDLNVNILAGGFSAWGGYNTVAINARANANVNVPKELFAFLKEGVTNQDYNISRLRASAVAYGEIAFNHSRQFGKDWRLGAAVKFLVGMGNIDARLKTANLNLSPEGWVITADGTLSSNVKGLSYQTKVDSHSGRDYVSGINVSGTGVNGFGMGFDLGAVFTPSSAPDWRFSAAVVDLGFIRWDNNVEASTNGPRTFMTDKYTFNVDNDASNSFKNEWEKVRDDLASLYQLQDNGDVGAQSRPLATTLNFGIEYILPMYRNLSFGLLNTTRIQGQFSWTDFRLSANCSPHKVIDLGANVGVGTFGWSFGWMANIHAGPFNLFAGMDNTPGKLAKQGIPLNSRVSFNAGLNWLF